MPNDDLSVRRARNVRRALVTLIDRSEVRPRKYDHLESVSLALFARMAELHETVCLLVSRKRLRDAVVLARTLCEANITLYWLTNDQRSDERIDRYVNFGAQVQLVNMERVKKYFNYEYTPKGRWEVDLLEDARNRFRKDRYKWNKVPISEMAAERDIYDPVSTGTPPSMRPVYELFYYWYSLLAHPCIKAIENFLPSSGVPFKCFQPSAHQTVPEMHVVFLSTCWLFSMALRISKITLVKRGDHLDRIWKKLKSK